MWSRSCLARTHHNGIHVVARRRPLTRHHGPSRRSMSSSSTKTKEISTVNTNEMAMNASKLAGAVFCGTLAARYLYNSLDHSHSKTRIAPDASQAVIRIRPAPPAQSISQKTVASETLKKVDAAEFTAFLDQQQTILNDKTVANRTLVAETLHANLTDAMQDAHGRVKLFADWYFAYATTYKLLAKASSSALKHAVNFGTEQTLSERVSEDLQEYIRQKYQAIVLRPASTDPQIHRAFSNSLREAHAHYLETIKDLDESVREFVQEQSQDFEVPPVPSDVALTLDWSAQLQKVEHVHAQYEKFPERTVLLLASGAAAGKVAGGAATGTAAKAIAAKLAAPFATKAATAALSGKAAAGAASGALLAGPAGGVVGAVAGAAIGVGVDMGVNAGLALLHRQELEKDVHASLNATILEWEERLLPELDRVQGVWYSHAQSALSVDTKKAN